MTHWAIFTGEYPPWAGGVSDYTKIVAEGLVAAGDRVSVFAPRIHQGPVQFSDGIEVFRLPGRWGSAARREAEIVMKRAKPDRVLIQYVPHSFGCKAMNVPFVYWVQKKVCHIAPVWVMFHEVAYPFSWWPIKYAVLGLVTRWMASVLAGCAERVFVSIPGWVPVLRRLCPQVLAPEWLPIPATIANSTSSVSKIETRARLGLGAVDPLIGHFGTFGVLIAPRLTSLLAAILTHNPAVSALMMGRGSSQYRDQLGVMYPAFDRRILATGELSATDVSAYLSACDLLIQPYPDGVSSRRTSVMAGLANGVPVITNLGALSEPLWAEGGVEILATEDSHEVSGTVTQLLANPAKRAELALRGRELYTSTFSLDRTISALRASS